MEVNDPPVLRSKTVFAPEPAAVLRFHSHAFALVMRSLTPEEVWTVFGIVKPPHDAHLGATEEC